VKGLAGVLILAASAIFALCAMPIACGTPDVGFRMLFNGKDLSGWDGPGTIWSVEDGAITGRTTERNQIQENAFLVWQGGVLANFELRASFRLVANNDKNFANSGIYYRSRLDPLSKQILGYQGDMDASLPEYLGALYEDDRGTIAKCGQRVRVFRSNGTPRIEVTGTTTGSPENSRLFSELAAGHWLTYVIIADGNHIRHSINGVPTADVTEEDDNAPRSGLLALQVHHGPAMLVQFKNIEIKVLP